VTLAVILAATTVTLDTQMLSVLTGVIVPLLVGLLTKLNAGRGIKAVINALLSAAAAALALIVPDVPFELRSFVITWAQVWVISIASYYGFHKPTGVAPAVQQSTANVGVG
jgi:hypothetical protein